MKKLSSLPSTAPVFSYTSAYSAEAKIEAASHYFLKLKKLAEMCRVGAFNRGTLYSQ